MLHKRQDGRSWIRIFFTLRLWLGLQPNWPPEGWLFIQSPSLKLSASCLSKHVAFPKNPKTNVAPEKWWGKNHFPFRDGVISGHVSFQRGQVRSCKLQVFCSAFHSLGVFNFDESRCLTRQIA